MRVLILATAMAALCSGCNGVAWNSDILNGVTGGRIFDRPSDPAPQVDASGAPLDATGGVVVQEEPAAQTPSVPQQGAVGVGGSTVASLGDPGVPGLWLETPLVSQAGSGRVRTANGSSLVLTLKPLDGAGGSLLSIDAMRALGVPLTELVELSVQPLG
ncbi:hypothetical protein KMP13_07190 [Epibacterium ulvae]|uniref:hypothetical protein n=1 Tax=Epibacterium ulvae TaxID=1156985 RepID=UPI001BFBFB23|nr:hypothetical protein [Epibacterium ulvae]MBT8153682.1 hypothetical protein [Epibacterium ulvae]